MTRLIVVISFILISSQTSNAQNVICSGKIPLEGIDTSIEGHKNWLLKFSDTTKSILKGHIEYNSNTNNSEKSLPFVEIQLMNKSDTLRTMTDFDGNFFLHCLPGLYKIRCIFMKHDFETDLVLQNALLYEFNLKFDLEYFINNIASLTSTNFSKRNLEELLK
jgi:hypothetical protein